VTTPTDITIEGDTNGLVIKPTNTALHKAYVFYVKVSTNGGSSAFFGPFTLSVGCFSPAVTFTESPTFINTGTVSVQGPTTSLYMFS